MVQAKMIFLYLKTHRQTMKESIHQLTQINKENFRSIFREYYPPLLNLSRHYLEDEDEAKGVVQEAFVKLWDIRLLYGI